MQEIRIAIIGHGFMGHEDEKMLLKMPGIRLVGFSDIDPKQLEDVAPGLKRYASNEELLADPEVDVVIIAANNNQHHKLVCQAARAGKDILCEKPVAMTVAELDDMIRVVNECGVKFTVHHQRRFDPDFRTIKEVFDHHQVGDVYMVKTGLYGFNGNMHDWHVYKSEGGGMLYDWGVHLLDQMLWMMPGAKIKQVFADVRNVINFEVDDYFKIILRMDNGITAEVELGTYLLTDKAQDMLPSDRKDNSVLPDMSLMENMALAGYNLSALPVRVDRKGERARYGQYQAELNIRAADPGMPVTALSGGNQQKVFLARWLDTGAEILLLDIAGALLSKLEERGIPKEEVKGAGMGVPGAVLEDKFVKPCVNLDQWGGFDVTQRMEALCGFPVKVLNDANAAALGEMGHGSEKGCKNMVFVTLGTGVGGGIIVDGKLLGGVHGAGGEIGHIKVVDSSDRVCGCGKTGCLEQYASATGLVKSAKELLADPGVVTRLRKYENLTCKDIFDCAAAGDEAANRLTGEMYRLLGKALAIVSCVCDPEVIVVGGGVARAGQPLLEGIQREFRRYAFPACEDTGFALATLGNDAGICGGVQMILAE